MLIANSFHVFAFLHIRTGASKVTLKTCQKTNLVSTRALPRNRLASTKIIFFLARLPGMEGKCWSHHGP